VNLEKNIDFYPRDLERHGTTLVSARCWSIEYSKNAIRVMISTGTGAI